MSAQKHSNGKPFLEANKGVIGAFINSPKALKDHVMSKKMDAVGALLLFAVAGGLNALPVLVTILDLAGDGIDKDLWFIFSIIGSSVAGLLTIALGLRLGGIKAYLSHYGGTDDRIGEETDGGDSLASSMTAALMGKKWETETILTRAAGTAALNIVAAIIFDHSLAAAEDTAAANDRQIAYTIVWACFLLNGLHMVANFVMFSISYAFGMVLNGGRSPTLKKLGVALGQGGGDDE